MRGRDRLLRRAIFGEFTSLGSIHISLGVCLSGDVSVISVNRKRHLCVGWFASEEQTRTRARAHCVHLSEPTSWPILICRRCHCRRC